MTAGVDLEVRRVEPEYLIDARVVEHIAPRDGNRPHGQRTFGHVRATVGLIVDEHVDALRRGVGVELDTVIGACVLPPSSTFGARRAGRSSVFGRLRRS